MKVELTRFRIKAGKSARVDEWLRLLNEHMTDVLVTLEREQMYVEVIFRERIGEEEFLYWFSIQGEEGEELETSPHAIDHLHRAFSDECIDTSYGLYDPLPQVIMLAPQVAKAIRWERPHESRIPWQGQQSHRPIRDQMGEE